MQISSTRSINITLSTEGNHLPSFTITNLCLNDTKATGPSDDNNTCSDTEDVTGPDGPNATEVTVATGELDETTVGKLST